MMVEVDVHEPRPFVRRERTEEGMGMGAAGGGAHPMQGLFIFSKSYYSANVRFKLGADSLDDANGNAGPYEQEGTRIVFKQWVQIHVRPGDRDHPILSRAGPDEVADFQLEGDHLTLIFPSKNRYILQRAAE